jgi:hypothetical protein
MRGRLELAAAIYDMAQLLGTPRTMTEALAATDGMTDRQYLAGYATAAQAVCYVLGERRAGTPPQHEPPPADAADEAPSGPHRNFALMTDALVRGLRRANLAEPQYKQALVAVLGEPTNCLCCGRALTGTWGAVREIDSYFCEPCCPVCHDTCETSSGDGS